MLSLKMTEMWTTMGSTLASFMFIWAIIRQYCPYQLLRDRLKRSDAYGAVEAYLSANTSKSAKRLKAEIGKDSTNLVLTMDEYERVTDDYKGVKVYWVCSKVMSASRSMPYYQEQEKRFYKLTFHKKYRDTITGSYLDHVMKEGKEIRLRNRQRKFIEKLIGEVKITPADVAENLMPKSPMDDADKCLSNLIEALEEMKQCSKIKEQGDEVEHIGAIKENGKFVDDEDKEIDDLS
ncbi:hypothetical protein TSUD_209150 [Trifolium subterraneum]|uniref:Uncharacterized protein n=1 Tax=Trifolium subterraneum TaxID=3900 RepID=A0A2Z6NS84_TRISU|nr:hypothetical protein TSUD_209150 [Trifolium subterraneum]